MSSPSPSKPSSSDGKLPEEAVMAGFHLFIVNGLAQVSSFSDSDLSCTMSEYSERDANLQRPLLGKV